MRAIGYRVDGDGRAAQKKPVRHQLIRLPAPSLQAILRVLCMLRVVTRKYFLAESPPTKLFSVKERAKAEALAQSPMAAD